MQRFIPMSANVYIGTAAWNIPFSQKMHFPFQGSHLEKYASCLKSVEINSSFYKTHKVNTFERWRDSVPDDFKFSVKLFKFFTHEQRLRIGALNPSDPTLRQVLEGPLALKEKLGVLLVQLPPSLNLELASAENFFTQLRDIYSGPLALEPRHSTWETAEARELMKRFRVSPVIADPQVIENEISAEESLIYYRLHGSPLVYKSNYILPRLKKYARDIKTFARTVQNVWCIFDNTTYGYATANALSLQDLLGLRPLASHERNSYI